MPNIPENNHLQKQVCTLNELSKRKVVEHNDLITSVAKMDKTPLKFFELAVACLDVENIPDNRTVYVSKKLLFSYFDVKSENKHSRFKETILKVHEQAVFHISELNEKKGKYQYEVISPLEKTAWNDYGNEVSFKFTESIMPYLVNLKNNFTQYYLSNIGKLNSKYSIILYKWLSMQYNQYEHYSTKGGRRSEQLESYRNPSIQVSELRRLTDTEKEYKEMSNFTRKVLNNSLNEINELTDLTVSYDKIKAGRSVDSIVFHIEKKRRADDNSYKLEDKAYQTDKKNNEQTLLAEAMQSKYTRLLLDNMLLSPYEMTDIKLMAGLQAHVYPLYDELRELRGLNGVKDHLSYVASKQEAYSKKNVAKYLKKSIEQYLPTVKRQDIDNE